MEQLTPEEIKTLLEIIDNTSVPYKQAKVILDPIVTKLRIQLVKNIQTISPLPEASQEATPE